jgi:hypothetical protein
MQLFINGRYAYRGTVNLDDNPSPRNNATHISELFRGALLNLDPGQTLEVVVRKREDT